MIFESLRAIMATPVAPQPSKADNPVGPRAQCAQPFATIALGWQFPRRQEPTIRLNSDAGYTAASAPLCRQHRNGM